MGKIFADRFQSTKTAKILPRENFPLYGISNSLNLLPCKFYGETILKTQDIGPQSWKLCTPSTQIAIKWK